MKILDFGLARRQSALEGPQSEAGHAMSGVVVGRDVTKEGHTRPAVIDGRVVVVVDFAG